MGKPPDPTSVSTIERFFSSRSFATHSRPSVAFHCLYPDVLRRNARAFVDGFPGKVLFAVKANPEPVVLSELWEAGVRSFDTASLAEITLVRALLPEADCYYMAPSKLVGSAESAFEDHGVRHFVADHESELARLLRFADEETTIHIRMKAMDPDSVYELSSKFGADEAGTIEMLSTAAASRANVGLSFNVGSLCLNPDAYRRAITAAGRLLNLSGVTVSSVDVGGGFPSPYPNLSIPSPKAFFEAIAEAAETIGLTNTQLICEPGRALVAEGQSLLTQVILIKDDVVFLNDGIYGSLKELDISKDMVHYPYRLLRVDGVTNLDSRSFGVAGPTCDTLDVLPLRLDLPSDVEVGDYIEFGMTGAYSNAMSTKFNGFEATNWVLIDGDLPPS